jgi:RND family efflux transporter MFP subunit
LIQPNALNIINYIYNLVYNNYKGKIMFLKSKRNTVITVAAIILLVVGGISIRKERAEKLADLAVADSEPWALHTAKVQQKDLYRSFTTLAELVASQQIDIRAQVSGTVLMMGPREGVSVNKNQIIAKIDVSGLIETRAALEAQKNAAVADVSRALDEYQRQLALKKEGLTSETLIEARRTAWVAATENVNALSRQIAALSIRIDYGEVKVPVPAVIALRSAEPGDAVQPGSLIYKLNVDAAARLKVTLPQEILAQVHPSTPVILTYGKLIKTIQLDRIFPALDRHALGTAEADLAQLPFNLASGSRVAAKVVLDQVNQAITLPHNAVVSTTGGKDWCFKVVKKANKTFLQKVRIDIILTGEKEYAVKGNLSVNDQVIVAHRSVLLRLKHNDPVVVE